MHMAKPESAKGEAELTALVERLYLDLAELQRDVELKGVNLPHVDPDNPTWEALFAWCETVAKLGEVTPEKTREIIRSIRQYDRHRA
jgi:hypothetical protein